MENKTSQISENSQFIVFIVLYPILTFGSVVWLTKGREFRPAVKHRTPALLKLQTLASSAIMIQLLLDILFHNIGVAMPCYANLWIMGIFAPVWVLCRVAAVTHIIAISLASLATLDAEVDERAKEKKNRHVPSTDDIFATMGMVRKQSLPQNQLSLSRSETGSLDLQSGPPTPTSTGSGTEVFEDAVPVTDRRNSNLEVEDDTTRKGFGSPYWFLHNRAWFSETRLVVLAAVMGVLQLMVVFVLQAFMPSSNAALEGIECIELSVFWVVWGPVIAYMVLLFLLLLYQLMYVKDQFGIREEMIIFFCFSAAYFINLFSLMFFPGLESDVRLFGVLILTLLFLPLAHVINVFYPAWKLRNDMPKESTMTKQGLVDLLASPSGMQEFKKFAADEFSAENVLFYQRCLALQVSLSSTQKQSRLRKIYELHCLDTSPYPLNLVHSTIKKIKEDFGSAKAERRPVPEKVFDSAVAEVLVLMFKDTYPRFLQTRKKQKASTANRWTRFAHGV